MVPNSKYVLHNHEDNQSVHFEILSYEDLTEEIFDDWQKKTEEWLNHPFQSAVWARAGLVDMGIFKYYLCVAIINNNYVGFFPFKLASVTKTKMFTVYYGLSWNKVMPVGLLIDPNESSKNIQTIVSGFVGKNSCWDILLLGFTNLESLSTTEIPDYIKNETFKTVTREHISSEIIGFDSFDDYLSSLSYNKRAQYRKIRRKLIDSGNVIIEHETTFDGEALSKVKKRLVNIYKESWKISSTDEYASITSDVGYEFFSNLLDGYAKISELHIMIAVYKGEDAAFYIGLHQSGNYCSLQTAYKEKYKKLGVGFLIQLENFKYVIDHSFKTNNLMAYQSYKKNLSATPISMTSYKLYSTSVKARLIYLLSIIKKYIIKAG